MFKKIVLSVVLLGLVLTISYIKVVKGNSPETANTISENAVDSVAANDQPIESYQETLDSLRQIIASQADERQANDLAHGHQVDSLFDVLDSVECVLHDRDAKLAEADSVTSNLTKTDAKTIKTDKKPEPEVDSRKALREKIVDHYKRQYAGLPKDLTDYERKVALYEIRLETAREFDITLTRLKEIRQDSGLSY